MSAAYPASVPHPTLRLQRWLGWGTALLICATSLVLAYYGPLRFRYPMPPGADVYLHLEYVGAILRGGIPPIGSSPFGFHLLVILFSRLTELGAMRAMALLAPMLLPLSAASVGLFGWYLFGRGVGLLTYALAALFCLQPFQNYTDGTLPDILASGVMMPLTFLCLTEAIAGRRYRLPAALTAVSLSLALFLTHHFSTVIFLMVSTLAVATLTVVAALRARWWVAILYVFTFAGAASGIVYALAHWAILRPAYALFTVFFVPIQKYPFFALGQPTGLGWDAFALGNGLGGITFQAGVAGAVLLMLGLRQQSRQTQVGIAFLASWFIIYFIGAQRDAAGEPTRLARDLALPVSILAAFFLSWGVLSLWRRSQFIAFVAISLVCGLLLTNGWTKARWQFDNLAFVRFAAADEEAYRYLVDTGLSQYTAVESKDFAWEMVAAFRGDRARFQVIEPEQVFKKGNPASCYLTIWYKVPIWNPSFMDQTVPASYRKSLGVQRRFADVNKELELSCRTVDTLTRAR